MRFKIDWASLIVGNKFTIFALFYFVFEGNFPSTSPRRAYIWRGDLTKVFLRHRFGGLYLEGIIHGGTYFRNFTVFRYTTLFYLLSLYHICFHQVLSLHWEIKEEEYRHRLLPKQKSQNKSHQNSPKSFSSFEFSASSCLREKR